MIRLPPSGSIAILLGLVLLAGCGQLDPADLIRPSIVTASLVADPSRPFEKAEVELIIRLEAGERAAGQTVVLEYVRLFEGSTWRTNEPAVHLELRLPEEAFAPFEAGEAREVRLDGYIPNEQLSPFCDESLDLLLALRSSGAHSLLGASREVAIDCPDDR